LVAYAAGTIGLGHLKEGEDERCGREMLIIRGRRGKAEKRKRRGNKRKTLGHKKRGVNRWGLLS